MANTKREELKALISRVRKNERAFVESAFFPNAPLGIMEAVFQRLGGSFLGCDALKEALEERSERACANPPKRAMCPNCGAESRFMECRSRSFNSTVGEIGYKRPVYRCANCNTWSPLDEELGMPSASKISPRLAELQDRFAIDNSMDEVADLLSELTECKPNHTTVRNSVISSGEKSLLVEAARAEQASPAGNGMKEMERETAVTKKDTLIIQIDGTGILMRTGSCREAKIGIVYLKRDSYVDSGKRHHIRRSREITHIGHWEDFADKLYTEALYYGLRSVGKVVVIGDCAEWIDRIVDEYFPNAIRIADFYHTLEYIADAGKESYCETREDEFEDWFEARRKQLRKGNVAKVVKKIKELKPRKGLGVKKTDAIRYLENHKCKMDYPAYRAMGLPIGSGAIEGRCKNLVGTRFKRTGARWNEASAAAVLSLRTLYRNGDWTKVYPSSTLKFPTPRKAA